MNRSAAAPLTKMAARCLTNGGAAFAKRVSNICAWTERLSQEKPARRKFGRKRTAFGDLHVQCALIEAVTGLA
jgi:hypothetical protein